MIDTQSPAGSYAKAIQQSSEREALNRSIVERNDRIKAAYHRHEDAHDIARRENIGVDYVRQIGKRWEA